MEIGGINQPFTRCIREIEQCNTRSLDIAKCMEDEGKKIVVTFYKKTLKNNAIIAM